MNRYVEQYPTAKGTTLAIASILWAFSLGALCFKYDISLFSLPRTMSSVTVTIGTFTILSIVLSLLLRKKHQLYEVYRQLSLGIIIALLLVTVMVRLLVTL